ncbi:MAG: glycosyl hydrolase-related protein, partial [Microcystaceae cyanobacterium]
TRTLAGCTNSQVKRFKPSEDRSNQWILRCYECQGEESGNGFRK